MFQLVHRLTRSVLSQHRFEHHSEHQTFPSGRASDKVSIPAGSSALPASKSYKLPPFNPRCPFLLSIQETVLGTVQDSAGRHIPVT